MRRPCGLLLAFGLAVGAPSGAHADDPRPVLVESVAALRDALASARPGTHVRVAPGVYEGGVHVAGVKGSAESPIVVEAADPKDPPLFRGGGAGIQWTDAEHVELVDLSFTGQTGNGLNLDDGGTPESPAHHVVLRRLRVTDVGPKGNCDGIKMSGLLDVRVEDCVLERWGTGGSGIDMVGCRRVVVEGCTFRHVEGTDGGSGIQAKGGSREITVRRCRFEHAGERALNVGGSTGLQYFRPPLETWTGPRYEAKDVTVEGNTFVGGRAPVAFVGVDGATFRFNTIYRPGRWAARILQETVAEGFVPSRRGVVEDNLIAFRSSAWSEGGVNVGRGVDAASFRFARNGWWCEDAPERTRSLVRLPTPEEDGVYGEDPRFRDAAAGDLTVRPGSPLAKVGAHALPK